MKLIRNSMFFKFLGTLVLIVSLQTNCGDSEKGQFKWTIGVSLLTREHPFYRDLEAGLIAAAQKDSVKLIIDAGEWDLEKHSKQVDNFIVKQVDAIILCPCDSKGIVTTIEKANQAGIPVFTSDIKAIGGKVVSHIASDNKLGGQLAGEYMSKLLNGRGKVAIIEQPVTETAIARVIGFKQAVEKYPGIEIVARLNGEGVRDKAMKVMEDIIQSHHELDGVFCINDESAMGALAAIEAAGRANINLIGFDAQDEALKAIERGTALKADVAQYPKKIARLTIETVVDYLRGNPAPPHVPVEVGIIDAKILAEQKAQQN